METVARRAVADRGLRTLIIALLAFFFVPAIPQMRALVPVDQPFMLFMPAFGACALIGWWAGGRAITAIVWIGLAAFVVVAAGGTVTPFDNLVRGWSLLLASGFGLVSLVLPRRPFFPRALVALFLTFTVAGLMSLSGRVTLGSAERSAKDEFHRRDAETMSAINGLISGNPAMWNRWIAKLPELAEFPAETEKQIQELSDLGVGAFPALLALESLAALALAFAVYRRIGGAALGAPLAALREFRFNDQLVWGLIVGLIAILFPSLTAARGLGRNLIVFFAALYAVRGLGVLAWFMAPGTLTTMLAVGFALILLPVLNVFAILGFMMLGIAALGLGLGDTWADWRHRVRSQS